MERYPELPFPAAYQMLNAIAHGYSAVDLDIVWLLERAAADGGLPLTAAGYLKPVDVGLFAGTICGRLWAMSARSPGGRGHSIAGSAPKRSRSSVVAVDGR